MAFVLLLVAAIPATSDKGAIAILKGGGGSTRWITPRTDPEFVYSAENKWAVCIGINDYDGRSSDLLGGPIGDCDEMVALLVTAGYNIQILKDGAGTATNIYAAIDWLVANEDSASEVVFFYSGHGFRTLDSSGFDSDIESDGNDEGIVSVDLYGLPDSAVGTHFTGIESTKFAAIFASCHSGGMFDEGELSAANRLIIAAAHADQYGWDYSSLSNTLFMYYWFEGFDIYNSFEDAFDYAYPLVVAEQPDSQPIMSDNYPGDFAL